MGARQHGRHAWTLACIGAALGCVTPAAPAPPAHDSILVVSPRCAGLRSCVLGYVTTAATAQPVAEAAVFLVRELEPGEDEPLRLFALTDEQGVFIVDEPPPGSYRISVYKEAASAEVAGLELGGAGTTMLPVRLATH